MIKQIELLIKQIEFLDYTGETKDVMVKHYRTLIPNTLIDNVLSFIDEHPGHFSASKLAGEDKLYITNNHNIGFTVSNIKTGLGFIVMDIQVIEKQGEANKFLSERLLSTNDPVMILFYNTFRIYL